MMKAIIDVGNWQSVKDLKTGRDLEENIAQEIKNYRQIKKLLSGNPYPGDRSDYKGIDWVTNSARAMMDFHNPDWLMLAYTQPMYMELYYPEDEETRGRRQEKIFRDVFAFAKEYKYKPVIVMTGGYVPFQGYIYQPDDLAGVLETGNWSFSLSGVTGASPEDTRVLQDHPHISQVLTREDALASLVEYGPIDDQYIRYFPDYIVAAEPGFAFRGFNFHSDPTYMVDYYHDKLPVYSALGLLESTDQIYGQMNRALDQGEQVLFVMIEGYRHELGATIDEIVNQDLVIELSRGLLGDKKVEMDSQEMNYKADSAFIPKFQLLANKDKWYSYRGLNLYMLLVAGKAFYQTEFPPVFNRSIRKLGNDKVYPLSVFFNKMPEESIGGRTDIKSAAVSSRSMITHMVAASDLTIECYARDRNSMGVMAAVK